MTDPQVNTEGVQLADRVQVEARGRVLDAHDRAGVPGLLIQLDGERRQPVWLPAELLVLNRPARHAVSVLAQDFAAVDEVCLAIDRYGLEVRLGIEVDEVDGAPA